MEFGGTKPAQRPETPQSATPPREQNVTLIQFTDGFRNTALATFPVLLHAIVDGGYGTQLGGENPGSQSHDPATPTARALHVPCPLHGVMPPGHSAAHA